MGQTLVEEQVAALKKLWTNKRMLTFQGLNLAMIVFSALMIWKTLMVVTKSESPVVVVLSGSMEPAFQRGDILFLNNQVRTTTTMRRGGRSCGPVCEARACVGAGEGGGGVDECVFVERKTTSFNLDHRRFVRVCPSLRPRRPLAGRSGGCKRRRGGLLHTRVTGECGRAHTRGV